MLGSKLCGCVHEAVQKDRDQICCGRRINQAGEPECVFDLLVQTGAAARTKNKFAPLTIAKGNGKHKYPASSFEFVEYPYRHLVLQVEERLAEIRRVASENRQLRRTLVAYEKKLSRYQALNHGDLYSAG